MLVVGRGGSWIFQPGVVSFGHVTKSVETKLVDLAYDNLPCTLNILLPCSYIQKCLRTRGSSQHLVHRRSGRKKKKAVVQSVDKSFGNVHDVKGSGDAWKISCRRQWARVKISEDDNKTYIP